MAYVKIRERGKKAFWFVTPKGDGTRRKIHAARFATLAEAEAFVAKYAEENPELDFKAVDA